MVNGRISLAGARLDKKTDWAWIRTPNKESMKEDLLLTSRKRGPEKEDYTLELFKEKAGLLGIPRALWKGKPDGKWDKCEIAFTGKLRPHQLKLESKVLLHYKHNCGGIIKATTGSGKTVLGVSIAAKLGYYTLVIVPTVSIMEQWKRRVKEFTGQEAGVIRQQQKIVRPITVATIQSLARRGDYGLKHKFGLVIFDEVHITPAETFSVVVPMFHCRYRLGLSATPRRKDGMENVFLWHIGGIVGEYLAMEIRPKVVVIPYYSPRTSQRYCVRRDGSLILGRYWNRVAQDSVRNRLVAKAVSQAFKHGREILVLSDRLDQLDGIRAFLEKEFEVPPGKIGYITGGRKEQEKQILLATYGCAGIGFDKPSLDTLVLATPRADVEQAVGRLMRELGRKRPVVIDIVDKASPIMQQWFLGRRVFYEKAGCKVQFQGM